jgi:integrase
MAERMRDGIIKRGSIYYYVVREKGRFPAKDRQGNPKLDADGNQIYVSVRQRWVKGASTREATKAMRDEARNNIHQGTYTPPQNLTVAQWLDQWVEGHDVKPSTETYYRAKIEYLKGPIGDQQLQALSPSGLTILWRDLAKSGGKNGKPLSRSTVAGVRRTLSIAMNDAVAERRIQINPVVGSKLPKSERVDVDEELNEDGRTAWSEKQLRTFLDHLDGERWAPMWQTFAGTGMRRGELAGLRWAEVDLDAEELKIRRNAVQLGKQVITGTPKSKRGRRTVKLDSHTVAALKAWRKQQAQERLAFGPAYADDEGLVFTWQDGRRVLPDYITKEFPKVQGRVKKALVAAEIEPLPELSVHELRHTHVTVLLDAGVPVHVVAGRVGDDPAVMMRVYAHHLRDADTVAADVFAKAVWGA